MGCKFSDFLYSLKDECKNEQIALTVDKYNRGRLPDSLSIPLPEPGNGKFAKILEAKADFNLIEVDGRELPLKDRESQKEVFLTDQNKIDKTFLPIRDEIKYFLLNKKSFSSLLIKLFEGITLVRIPKNKNFQESFNILHVKTAENPTLANITFIIGEENSRSTLFEEYILESPDGGNLVCGTFIFLYPGAQIEYNAFVPSNSASNSIFIRKGILTKDSYLQGIHGWFGGNYLGCETSIEMREEGGRAEDHHVFFSWGKNFYDFTSKVIHKGRNTFSRSEVRGVLTGSSRSVFRSRARIEKEAKNSDSLVQDHFISLSDKAHSDFIPSLEILNNDVKATHSASSGQIDKEKLFYMQSKGLDEISAKGLYIRGFFEKIIRSASKKFSKRVIKETEFLLEKLRGKDE